MGSRQPFGPICVGVVYISVYSKEHACLLHDISLVLRFPEYRIGHTQFDKYALFLFIEKYVP